MQIKTTMKLHVYQNGWKMLTIPSVGEDVKQLELSYTAMCVNSYNHFQNLFDSIS